MKRIHLVSTVFQVLLMFGSVQAMAGFPSYPPSVVGSYTFFEDSDNATTAQACAHATAPAGICAYAYVLPRGIELAKSDAGVPMLSQGMFFGSSWRDHTVVYNITLEPDYADYSHVASTIQSTLAARYGIGAQTVSVSPINISGMQFVVRDTFGAIEQDPLAAPAGMPAPGPSPTPSPAPSPTPVASATVYTQTISPSWTGDFHNIGSRFSVSIVGPIWDLEPGLGKMFLNPGGNAVVGQVSFGLAVKARSIDMKMDCDLSVFQQKVLDQTKSWNITHVSGPGYSKDTFDNEEWNAIRTNLKIADFCTVSTYQDQTVPQDQTMRDRVQEMFDQLFTQAFRQVTNYSPAEIVEGKDAKYTVFNSSSSATADAHVTLDFKDDVVFLLHSDLDFYAGGVTHDNLSPESSYICEHFEKYVANQGCIYACDPMTEVYLPHHPRAGADGCVDITTIPLNQ